MKAVIYSSISSNLPWKRFAWMSMFMKTSGSVDAGISKIITKVRRMLQVQKRGGKRSNKTQNHDPS
jgi:putative protein kinase ArgK-like GTPase of G3E family